jgi:hypothetical protein
VISVSKSKTGSSRKIKGLEEGSMLRLYLSSFETPTSTASRVRVNMLGETGEPEVAQLDSYFEDLLSFAEIANPPASRLFNDSFLEEILSRYYQQDTVFIARSVFSTQASDSVTGRLDSKRERLLVSPATGHTMTAFLSVAIIFSILVVFTKPRLSSMPKNPNSVIGTTQLLADSNEILSLLSSFGPVSWETIKNRCCGFQFRSTIQKSNSPSGACTEAIQISVEPNDDVRELRYLNAPAHSMKAPLVLNTVSMISVQIIIIGTIAALEIILRISGASNDFVDVSDQQYIHLTWTILPALFFSLISMYFAAVDSEVRSLTPYYKLYKGSSLSHMITLDLLDGSTPRLLWREYRTDSFPALATTACLLMSSFFTIFVGSLYSVVTLPNDETIGLRTLSSFNTSGAFGSNTTDLGKLPDFSSLTSTLILDSNLSYPSFTYETLAFPEFSVIDTPRKYQILPSDAINITIPALRSKMTCTRYSSSEIQMEVISAPIPGVPSSHQSHRETLAIDIKGVPHQSLTVPNGLTHNVELPLNERPDSDWIFGIADTCKSSGRLIWCSSDFLYVWGHKTNSSDQVGNHVSALACNESIEAVDTSTTFFGAELRIDPSVPPRPVNDSARTSTVSVHHSNGYDNDDWLSPYDYLAEGLEAPGTNLWPFFNLLTTSRYGIPVADLDNPQRDESVARAIIFQHGIIRAQVLNEGFRGPANMTNATLVNPPADPEMANDAVTYNGTLSSAEGRLRLAQDPATTRVLEALLAAALLLSAAGRLLMPSPKLLPRNPTSIANVAALVADGNILSILPENPQHVPDKDILAASGGGYLLRLGWWASSDGDNSRQRFGIFAVKISQESVFGWL